MALCRHCREKHETTPWRLVPAQYSRERATWSWSCKHEVRPMQSQLPPAFSDVLRSMATCDLATCRKRNRVASSAMKKFGPFKEKKRTMRQYSISSTMIDNIKHIAFIFTHHPLAQDAIGRIVLRHVAISKHALVIQQFLIPIFPFHCRRPHPPFKTDRFELSNAMQGHGLTGSCARRQVGLILGGIDKEFALDLDPPREFAVSLLWDVAVAASVRKEKESGKRKS